jgi:hypothetical protein
MTRHADQSPNHGWNGGRDSGDAMLGVLAGPEWLRLIGHGDRPDPGSAVAVNPAGMHRRGIDPDDQHRFWASLLPGDRLNRRPEREPLHYLHPRKLTGPRPARDRDGLT